MRFLSVFHGCIEPALACRQARKYCRFLYSCLSFICSHQYFLIFEHLIPEISELIRLRMQKSKLYG